MFSQLVPDIKMEITYTEIGIQINHFRFAVRIPRIRKPRFLRTQKVDLNASVINIESNIDLYKKYSKMFNGRRRKFESSSSLTMASSKSFEGGDDHWIKDFHARYNPVLARAKTEGSEDTAVYGFPDLTSTPVNLKILPLNRIQDVGDESHLNVSGVKIYENIEDGIREMLGYSGAGSDDLNSSYEIVTIDNRVLARAHFRPRTLKFCQHN